MSSPPAEKTKSTSLPPTSGGGCLPSTSKDPSAPSSAPSSKPPASKDPGHSGPTMETSSVIDTTSKFFSKVSSETSAVTESKLEGEVAKDAGKGTKNEVAKEVTDAAESDSLLEYILKKLEVMADSCKADSGFSLTIGLAVVSILALNIYKSR